MKKVAILNIFLVIAFFATVCSSCNKPEEIPVETYSGEATHTIAELFQYHTLGVKPATLITDKVVIKGVVISTDKHGSCYKEIFIQDETGGISIRTANSAYYNKYRIGQTIYVECQGLYLGSYIANNGNSGWYQLGLWGNDEMQYIPSNVEMRHIFRSGILVPEPAPKVIRSTNNITEADFHTLVELPNCSFVDANGSNLYFDASQGYSTINRNIQLENGNTKIIARISQYIDWADEVLPEGKLNIKGILTKYGSDYQLMLRSINDVTVLPPPGGYVVFQYNMESSPFSMGWSNQSVAGTAQWEYKPDYKVVTITGSTSEMTDCYLVSPQLDFGSYRNVKLYFTHRNFNGLGTADQFRLYYSTIDGEWIPLEIPTLPSSFTETVIPIPDEAVSKPTFRIGFRYTDQKNSNWAINNIQFKSNPN